MIWRAGLVAGLFLSPDGIDMVADTIRLMLFPAVMAFAASSDLLTMTISNRVSLILAESPSGRPMLVGTARRTAR